MGRLLLVILYDCPTFIGVHQEAGERDVPFSCLLIRDENLHLTPDQMIKID